VNIVGYQGARSSSEETDKIGRKERSVIAVDEPDLSSNNAGAVP
jgi:hypothetical protein